MSGRGGSRRATGANSFPIQNGGALGTKPSFGNHSSTRDSQNNQQDVKPPVIGTGSNAQPSTQPQGFGVQKQGFGSQPQGFGVQKQGFGTQQQSAQKQGFGEATQQQNTQSFGGNRFDSNAQSQGSTSQQQPTQSFGNNRFGQQDGQSTGTRFNNAQGNNPVSFSDKDNQNVGGQEQRGKDKGRRIGNGHVPTVRDVDEIYKEDEQSKELYSTVFQTDEAIIVEGGGDVACLDNWTDAPLNKQIMENIAKAGYVHPRKVQAYSIPLILEGLDMKSQAETGSGKSAAFLIPLIHMIAKEKESSTSTGLKNKAFALIIEPTRELTLQLYDQARKIAYRTGVQIVKCYGQYDITSNGSEVMMGCDIVVATPGRLLDFIKKGTIDVSNLKYFVLDEADRLISDPSFMQVVQDIRGVTTFPDKVQSLLFSATFPPAVQKLAEILLKENHAFVHNEKTVAANSKIEQTFIECPGEKKKLKVLEILQEELKKAKSKDEKASQPRTLVFVQKRSDADLMALFLSDQGICATTINGDRPQRERERALAHFRSNSTPVLVATDVCARGLDIKDLDFVINMDLPKEIETFVHRIGRTGRLKEGKATTLFDVLTDRHLASDLVKLLVEGKKCKVPEFLRDAANITNFGGNSGGFGGNTNGFGGVKRFGSQAQQTGEQALDSNTGAFGVKRFGSQAQQSSTGFDSQAQSSSTGFGEKRFGAQAQSSSTGFGEKRFGDQSQPTSTGFGGKSFGDQSQPTNGFVAKGFGAQPTSGFVAKGFGAQPTSGFVAKGFGEEKQSSGNGAFAANF